MEKENDQILELFRKDILSKRSYNLVKLESERNYETQYGIGRQRLRTFINSLVSEGLLVKNEGGSTYILPKMEFRDVQIVYPKDIRINDPFYSNLWLNITTLAAKHAIHTIFIPTDEYAHARNDIPTILIGIQQPGLLNQLQKHFRFLVGIQTYSTENNMIQIYFDNKKIGYTAVKTLLERGHKNLLFVGGPEVYASARFRKIGFEKACARFGVPYTILSGKMNWAGGYGVGQEICRILKKPDGPTAAFVVNDWMAIGLIQCLREQGITVPDDLSIISVDNITISAQVFPALTTFSQDLSLLTAELFTAINQITPTTYETLMHKRIIIPHILVSRQTLASKKENTNE